MTGPCRLCGGDTIHSFRTTVRLSLEVAFERCRDCGSLQTEVPYWTDEAYADPRRILDIDAVQRNLSQARAAFLLLRLVPQLRARPTLDWGAGDGLLVRLLRDWGVDCRYGDRYAQNLFAPGHEHTAGTQYGLVTAFEVWEHLAEPRVDLAEIFALHPTAHLVSTGLYRGQDQGWSYLNTLTGRHVFFYSPAAIRWIAEQHRYEHLVIRNLILFTEPGLLSRHRRRLLAAALSRRDKPPLRVGVDLWRKPTLGPRDREFARAAVVQRAPWTQAPAEPTPRPGGP